MRALGWTGKGPASLAVSGGGDSLALMHLYGEWARERGAELPAVLIVDHGLRAQSSREAERTARWARRAGFEAHVLSWRGKKPHADVEAAARNARLRLIGEWCRAQGAKTVFLAHTEDDQAETFLLRLARGSGVDGLAAMQACSRYPLAGFDIEVLRPLLGMARSELREFLAERSQPWLEDPMNMDPRFARARLRAVMPAFRSAGLTSSRVAGAARHLGRAREALEAAANALLSKAAQFDQAGYALLDGAALARAPREIGLRAVAAVFMAVSGEAYRPRFEKLDRLFDAVVVSAKSSGRTLHGCRVSAAPRAFQTFGTRTLLVTRDARPALRAPDVLLRPGRDAVWDNRFRLRFGGETKAGALRVRALGERPDLAEVLAHVPAPARASLPAVFRGAEIVTIPHANPPDRGNFPLAAEFLGVTSSQASGD
ncbi:MAG: tRNA lysidine(34) synthetase TilS [Alphaproteobacteria bacterium]